VEEEDVGAGEQPVGAGGERGRRRRDGQAGRFGRLVVRGTLLGVAAGAVTMLWRGWPAAVGVAVGSLAGAVYVWGYLRSHMGHAGRARIFDPALARQSVARIAALALAGAGMRLLGETPFVGYLVGFAVAFGVLVALEAPRVARQLKAGGLIG
jgi:hypothetical protein